MIDDSDDDDAGADADKNQLLQIEKGVSMACFEIFQNLIHHGLLFTSQRRFLSGTCRTLLISSLRHLSVLVQGAVQILLDQALVGGDHGQDVTDVVLAEGLQLQLCTDVQPGSSNDPAESKRQGPGSRGGQETKASSGRCISASKSLKGTFMRTHWP